jgi:hypothetical protein
MSPGFLVVSTYHSAKIGDFGKAGGDFFGDKNGIERN